MIRWFWNFENFIKYGHFTIISNMWIFKKFVVVFVNNNIFTKKINICLYVSIFLSFDQHFQEICTIRPKTQRIRHFSQGNYKTFYMISIIFIHNDSLVLSSETIAIN